MDFTLEKYEKILRAGLDAGYRSFPVSDWHDLKEPERRGIMVRHDVDRRPENALAMARLENGLGVRSTYYFRILPCAFHPDIITEIGRLGHEIGYHYEDWHLAKADRQKAIALFADHLARIRTLAPVRSIAMHGSPLARENNMTIWEHFAFADHGVNDAILSFDYRGYVFFTDSGRTFGVSGANLRDYLGDAEVIESVRSSDDLAAWLSRRPREQIQINVHPERWNPPGMSWFRQWGTDMAANAAKRALKLARARR
ncbi:MAG: hypothetical protein IPL47_16740 [Phyllobacteriaceae bacterium]|nr:hypothetical protein [Phyllobacteriaceae bacterium]